MTLYIVKARQSFPSCSTLLRKTKETIMEYFSAGEGSENFSPPLLKIYQPVKNQKAYSENSIYSNPRNLSAPNYKSKILFMIASLKPVYKS